MTTLLRLASYALGVGVAVALLACCVEGYARNLERERERKWVRNGRKM